MNTIFDAMTCMYQRAKGEMTPDELHDVGNALTMNAVGLARRMHEVTEGVACLVAYDGGGECKGDAAGTFQDSGDVFTLLCALAANFDAIAAMTDVGSAATSEATSRRARTWAITATPSA